MRLPTVLLLIVSAALMAEQTVSRVPLSGSRDAIRAFSPFGDVVLSVATVQLEILSPSGPKERGSLVVVHDPRNGHYFWRFTPAHRGPADTTSFLAGLKSGAVAVYASRTGIIYFYLTSRLYIQERRESAPSLDAAEDAAIDDIQTHLPAYQKDEYVTGLLGIPIRQTLEADFACKPLSAICQWDETKINSVNREGDNWHLVLRNRFDQEIVLDSQFRLVSSRRLRTPSK